MRGCGLGCREKLTLAACIVPPDAGSVSLGGPPHGGVRQGGLGLGCCGVGGSPLAKLCQGTGPAWARVLRRGGLAPRKAVPGHRPQGWGSGLRCCGVGGLPLAKLCQGTGPAWARVLRREGLAPRKAVPGHRPQGWVCDWVPWRGGGELLALPPRKAALGSRQNVRDGFPRGGFPAKWPFRCLPRSPPGDGVG